ncbi:MAG: hypothetical protein K6F55_06605 [Eubacterium sp.]|nr:hypothetical protein [Eubacterium sp.]
MNKDSMIKRYTKQIIALILAVFLIVSVLPAGNVEAASKIKYEKKTVAYYNEKTTENYAYIYISGLTKKQKVKNVTTSNPAVVTLKSISKSFDKTKTVKVVKSAYSNTYSSGYSTITLYVKGVGTATVSYKIGNKTYKTKVTVKKFASPSTSIIITGLNEGKNINSKLDWVNHYCDMDSFDATNSKLTVKTRKGWKLTYADFDYESTGLSKSRTYDNGFKTFKLGNISKKDRYYLNLTFTDAYDNTYSVTIHFNKVQEANPVL